jgi:hypothetical protein
MLKLVDVTTVPPGVNVKVQLAPGVRLAQVFPVSVTFPSSAVPTKFDVILRAVVLRESLVTVRAPVDPFAISCSGDPVILS